jgi:serine/threonine protein kinase
MKALSANNVGPIGPYRIIAELGSGAMGRVLLGIGQDGRPVAVKVIHEWLVEDEEFRARFRDEVRKSRQVAGQYTSAVVKDGRDDPIPWLASEFLRGPTLNAAVAAAGPLPETAVIRLAAGLASALESIHEAGIIHRDLKPGNVILTSDGPRVIDFGIARAADGPRHTRVGGIVGTPSFMSPEQARAQPLTAASDMFSLGSVLVMACTGTSPFAAASAEDARDDVVRAEPDLTGLPERIRAIVAPCLAPVPADRPTPAELLEIIGTVPPTASPWPDAVAALADEQQRELARLFEGAEIERTREVDDSVDDEKATKVLPEPTSPDPEKPTEVLPGPPEARRRFSTGARAVALGACVLLAGVATWFITRGIGDAEAADDPTAAEGSSGPGYIFVETTPARSEPVEPVTSHAPQWRRMGRVLTLFLASNDGIIESDSDYCQAHVDFDQVDAEFDTVVENIEGSADSVDDEVDLVFDPCDAVKDDYQSGYTSYLRTSWNSYGRFFDSPPTAEACASAIDADRPELDLRIESQSPQDAPLQVGMTLCLRTSEDQIAIAEILTVDPQTSSSWMAVGFEVTLWAWN